MKRGFFVEDIRPANLSELGDSLVKLNRAFNREMFRSLLEEVTRKEKGACGRSQFDCVPMFNVLILQRIYDLSDDQTEYQIYLFC